VLWGTGVKEQQVNSNEISRSRRLALAKRLVDLAGASLLLSLASPLLFVIAVAIKATSRGPVLFQQERLGRNGTRFRLYKLRTMHVDAEDVLRTRADLYDRYLAGGCKLADGQDPRITAVGRFLRRTNLDELPQLFNVLLGDMSLVGPRPIVPAETVRYPEFAATIRFVRPGITGPWQIQRETSADYGRRAELDRQYATTCSLHGDVMILKRTVIGFFRAAFSRHQDDCRFEPSARHPKIRSCDLPRADTSPSNPTRP
jgi:exopolysaccharide production protein ExoY